MSRLTATLTAARAENRAALIGYLPAGYPSVDGAIAAMTAMVDGGVDIVEVGLPYSDPVMDGPTIQVASEAALAAGTTTHDVLHTVSKVAASGAPTLVMSYWNPVEQYNRGDGFAVELAAAGGSGVILPDLIPEEAGPWLAAASAADLDTVFLVAPSSSPDRLRYTTAHCTGFVYAASLMGVTGARARVSRRAADLVARTREVTGLPVCVGLGVSDGEQAAEVAGYADGVIVGSAFVRRLIDAPSPEAGAEAVRRLAQELSEGVRTVRES